MRAKTLCSVIAFVALLAVITGCGGPKVSGAKITGTLIKDGAPFTVPDKNDLSIVFTDAASESSKSISASANYDNAKKTFTVPGPTGHGLPPGNYHVIVRCTPYAAGDNQDLFGGAYLAGPNSKKPLTPLTLSVTDTKDLSIEINLDKNQVIAK